MGRKEILAEIEQIQGYVKLGGWSKEAVDREHARGKLTCRERVNLLFDEGTLVETNMYAQHQCSDFGMDKFRPYGDGLITGFGKIDGRVVYVYAMDPTVYGGSLGYTTQQKMNKLMADARNAMRPCIGLWDGGGGRIQEGSSYGFTHFFAENVLSSGVTPQISLILGNCAGGAVYSPALTDFIIMVEGTSRMFITGPKVIKEVTGEEISMDDLGGPKAQSEISGVCDLVAKDEREAFQILKNLLGFLPSNYLEQLPWVDTGDNPKRCDEELAKIVPENPRAPFDMHRVISKVVDNGDFLEIKPRFARNMITGFARLDGYPVGIVANQPAFLAGSLDCDASDKAARFYRTCDCFNVPIITLADVPGYLPGVDQEHKGIIRHGAKMLYGIVEATVPKISVVVRKAYGGSYTAMGTKTMGVDYTFAWNTAEIALMGAEGAVEVLYRKEIREAEDKDQVRQEKLAEYRRKYSTPLYGASRMIADTIIKPEETRPALIRALDSLRNRKRSFPARKHGNIPL
jgi:acetyl-CoA carboxylase carboxyltransferase component